MANIVFFLVMVAIVIFVVGFTAGYIFENIAVSYTQQEVERMRNAIENMQLEEMFVSTAGADCNLIYATLGSISYNLYEMVDMLKSTSPDSENFWKAKEDADLLSLRAWILAQNIKKSCVREIVPILFVYSGNAESDRQDAVLKELKGAHESLLVYSVDFNSNQSALKLVRDAYGITAAPSMVIDSTSVGSMNSTELESFLAERFNASFAARPAST